MAVGGRKPGGAIAAVDVEAALESMSCIRACDQESTESRDGCYWTRMHDGRIKRTWIGPELEPIPVIYVEVIAFDLDLNKSELFAAIDQKNKQRVAGLAASSRSNGKQD